MECNESKGRSNKEKISEEEDDPTSSSSRLRGSMAPGNGQEIEEWVTSVRKRTGKCPVSGARRSLNPEAAAAEEFPAASASAPDHREGVKHSEEHGASSLCNNQAPELSLLDRLANADMLDIESSEFSWDKLTSLHHTKQTNTDEICEDELNKALEVTVNSGGVIFFALFSIPNSDDLSRKEAAAVIKIASSRMATQSERLGYEFAKWIGVKTPQARVVHSSTTEWQQIKDAAENARNVAVNSGDEVGELTCSELLEALEFSRCLYLMNYVHGSPLLENSNAFDSKEGAENTAAALGRVLMLDLVLRNEDRLRCPHLGWRGNHANLLFADKGTYENVDAVDLTYDSVIGRCKPQIAKKLKKERRAVSVNGRLNSHDTEVESEASDASCLTSNQSINRQVTADGRNCGFHIVAIDSGVPRRPPAGKRAKDQENYPRLVELIINNLEYCSVLLSEITHGKLGCPVSQIVDSPKDYSSCLSEFDMPAVVHAFRGGFRAALRDLQGFHLFLLTLYQKLDGLLRVFLSIINKAFNDQPDKDDSGAPDSPLHPVSCGSTPFLPACKERHLNEIHSDSNDFENRRGLHRYSGSRESFDTVFSTSRENWGWKHNKGNGEPQRSLRLTMKLRDFNRFAKVDAELNKELEQWNEMLRTDVIKMCQDTNFNMGFFEGSDNNVAVDAYELKVRLEHILERIALISDAASTERPSAITDYLYIGGALAAKSIYTLQHLGITHILCLCSNEIGQSDTQYPDLFEYRNFSVNDSDDEDISNVFEEASDFIDYVDYLGGKILVHCFEGRSRSATVVLAYLILRKGLNLLEAWNMLKKVHHRAQPNDGFAKILLDLENRLYGKTSMEWQQKKPTMKVCPICGNNAGLSSGSLKLHLQKSHRQISSGSVDSAMSLEIQKALEALEISHSSNGNVSPIQKQPSLLVNVFSH